MQPAVEKRDDEAFICRQEGKANLRAETEVNAVSASLRRFTLLYDRVFRQDILQEAWRRVKSNKWAAGVDQVDIEAMRDYGEGRFLSEVEQELRTRRYRTALVRRVHIPKPGQPGKTRSLGIPTVKDRVVQMAVKLVIEPLFEADFMPCSFGFRPKKTPRMVLSAIVQTRNRRLCI